MSTRAQAPVYMPPASVTSVDVGGREVPRSLLRLIWTAVAFLTLVGVSSAVLRMTLVVAALRTPADRRAPLTAVDELSTRIAAWGLGVPPGTPEFARARQVVVRFTREYTSHPVYTAVHMLPGILILLLAPFQFSRRVRSRHLRLHRWSGRTILVACLASVLSALWFGVIRATLHPTERATIATVLAIFVFSATRAYVAIRRKDVATHREWMIRTYAILIGIATVRVVSLAMPPFFRGSADLALAVMTSWWIGWALTVGAAELWIRYSRRLSPPVASPA